MGTSKAQGELWGKAPTGWAEIQEPQHKPLWEAMLDVAGVRAGTHFLDAGCGAGGASILAAERRAHVSGLDAAAGLLEFAQKRVPEGAFRIGDIEDLPYDDNAFDAVFAASSVQYTGDRITALRELGRVCTPDGHIVAALFDSPDNVEFSTIFKAMGALMPDAPKGGGPFELSAPSKFEKLFSEAGLEVLESGKVNCPFRYANFEEFWTGNVAAGPVQGMLQITGKEQLESALHDAVKPYMQDDGSILIQPNVFKYVVAKV